MINTAGNYMTIQNKFKIPLKQLSLPDVNMLNIKNDHMSKNQANGTSSLVKKFPKLFADQDKN